MVDGDNIITESTASAVGKTDSGVNVYNASGVKLNAEPYSYLPLDAGFGKDGLVPVTDKQNKFYYIDRKAKKQNLISVIIRTLCHFSNGLAAVQGKNNKYGYINTQGKLVIPLMYEKAHYFQGGTALVSVYSSHHYYYQLITPDNKVVARFRGSLSGSTQKKDNREARYTIEIDQYNKKATYVEYNHKGERIDTEVQPD